MAMFANNRSDTLIFYTNKLRSVRLLHHLVYAGIGLLEKGHSL